MSTPAIRKGSSVASLSLRDHYFRARKTKRFKGYGLIEFAQEQAARTDGKAPFGEPKAWQEWLDVNVKEATDA